MAGPFSYPQAQEIAQAFAAHGVRYLFLGKSGAIILGFPDTTQDADLFVQKSAANARALVAALRDLAFPLSREQEEELQRCKDFNQIRSGPFDLDVIFAPDGIETFEEAEARRVVIDGLPVCHIDDIIRSKEEANRVKDRESLPRLRAFRDWWIARRRAGEV